jgi:predicted transcriptional regulator
MYAAIPTNCDVQAPDVQTIAEKVVAVPVAMTKP